MKRTAEPFYARLIELQFIRYYPWTQTTTDDDDFALVNIGTAKKLFSFLVPTGGTLSNPTFPPMVWNGNLAGTNLGGAGSSTPTVPALPPGTAKSFYMMEYVAPLGVTPYHHERSWAYIHHADVGTFDVTSSTVGPGAEMCWYLMDGRSTAPTSLYPNGQTDIRAAASYTPNSATLLGDFQPVSDVDLVKGYAGAMIFGGIGSFYWKRTVPWLEEGYGWCKARLATAPGTLADRLILEHYIRSDTGSVITFYLAPGTSQGNLHTFSASGTPGETELLEVNAPTPRTLSPGDAAGPKYRKIGLNGVPMPDSKPQANDETNIVPEETFIDAYNRQLRHSVTDTWSTTPSSDLPLSARRDVSSETWSWSSGLRPMERPDRPFGPGWTSNLTPHISIERSPTPGEPVRATVIDEQGGSHSFIRINNLWIAGFGERNNAKSAYDQLVFHASDGTYELIKRYGGRCIYQPTEITQYISPNRVMGSDQTMVAYNYYRIISATTMEGGALTFEYPTAGSGVNLHNVGLIPRSISDPLRQGQRITITQNDGRIDAVRGPSGETVYYTYKDLPMGDHPGGGNMASYTAKVLWKVTREVPSVPPTQQVVEYDYTYANEAEPAASKDPTVVEALVHGHIDLSKLTDELGRSYSFEHAFDQNTTYVQRIGDEFNLDRLQLGKPRMLTRVTRPDTTHVDFSGARGIHCAADGTLTATGTNTLPTVTTQVTGPCGTYTYLFHTPFITRPKPSIIPSERGILQISFQALNVTCAAGTEYFTFKPNAAMALASVTDLSNKTTTFEYGDAVQSHPVKTSMSINGSEDMFFDDPTAQINAMNGRKTFTYNGLRKMTSVTDERNVVTSYEINGNGMRTSETIKDETQKILRVTNFEYANATYPGFMTKQTVETTGQAIMTGEEAPIGKMVTKFVPDGAGRVQDQIVYAGPNETLPLTTSYTYTGNGSKKTVTDARGYTTTFDYQPQTLRLQTVTYPGTPATTKQMFYDLHGNLTSEINELGVKTIHQYDLFHRREKSTVDLNGNGDADGRHSVPAFPTAAEAVPVYDGDLVSETTYNAHNLPVNETNGRGIVTHHEYDVIGRRVKTTVNWGATDPEEILVTETLDFVGGSVFDSGGFRARKVIDARGFVTDLEYDGLYRNIKTTLTDTSTTPNQTVVTETHYDAVGNAHESIDALGAMTVTDYDGLHRPYRVTLPVSTTGYPVAAVQLHTTYTAGGQVWTSTDALSGMTIHKYDNAGREIKTSSPAVPTGAVNGHGDPVMVRQHVRKAYDACGNVKQVEDALGNITDTVYDVRNRPTEVTGPVVWNAGANSLARPMSMTAYDAAGQALATTDPLGNVTQTSYDRAGRACVVIAPPVKVSAADNAPLLATITRTAYDSGGNAVKVQRPKGLVTTNVYDGLSRLTSTQRAAGIAAATFGYDKAGNRTRVTDGRGHVTLLSYDAQKRPLTETYADTGDGTGVAVVSYGYNALEKVQRTDAKGQVTTYHYDVRHQLRAVKYWGANATLSNTRSCSYDAAGRLLTVSETANAAAAVSQVYDALGRVTAESSVGQTQAYRYDINGNRISAQYSTGRSVSTRYDALGRPETITEGGRVTQYEYDLAGRAMRQDLGNGQRTLNAYDAQGRLEQRTCYQTAAATVGTALVEYQWRHDAHGNVLRQQETWPAQVGGVGGSNQVTTMAYDDADRLTHETITPATGVVKLTVNGYDDADNRDVKDEYEDAVLVKHTTYASDARNRLSAFAEFDAANNNTQLKAVSYGYDKDGNRALRQERNVTTQAVEAETVYAWDQDNRLSGVALPDGHSHAYGYDHRTRRISQQESAAGSVVKTTDIVFSGGLSLAEYEAAGAGPPPAAPTVEYQRGPDMGGGVGGMLYSLRASGGSGSTIKYSLSNGRGDIVAQSDQTATLTWAASYEAFGKRTSEAGANADKQRSNSKDEDPTGLVNEGFRYRDLETGAFISRDPAGHVDGPNMYAYVSQNPWTSWDPEGLCGWADLRGLPNCSPQVRAALDNQDRERAASLAQTCQAVGQWVGEHPRTMGAVKAVGGAAETTLGVAGILTPEPTMVTKGLGCAAVAHGSDTCWAGLKQMWNGAPAETNTQRGITALAGMAGASPEAARTIGAFGDAGIGFVTTLGASTVTSSAAVASRVSAAEVARLSASRVKTGTVSALVVPNGLVPKVFVGASTRAGGAGGLGLEDSVYSAATRFTSKFNWGCAEGQAISKAINAGVNPLGGTSFARAVSSGAPLEACDNCKSLLSIFRIKDAVQK